MCDNAMHTASAKQVAAVKATTKARICGGLLDDMESKFIPQKVLTIPAPVNIPSIEP
jgi:hypothetical protein